MSDHPIPSWPPSRPKRIEKPVILLVEGEDYRHVLMRLIPSQQYPDVQVCSYGGHSRLDGEIEVIKTLSGFYGLRIIGVICDAEDDPHNNRKNNAEARFNSIQSTFHKRGFVVPDAVKRIKAGSPSTACLIMPDGQRSGCLETACLEAYTGKHRHCAEEYLKCVDDPDRTGSWRAKVLVHTLISGSDKPESALGQGLQRGLWNPRHPSLDVLREFIELLQNHRP